MISQTYPHLMSPLTIRGKVLKTVCSIPSAQHISQMNLSWQGISMKI